MIKSKWDMDSAGILITYFFHSAFTRNVSEVKELIQKLVEKLLQEHNAELGQQGAGLADWHEKPGKGHRRTDRPQQPGQDEAGTGDLLGQFGRRAIRKIEKEIAWEGGTGRLGDGFAGPIEIIVTGKDRIGAIGA